jgi:acetoin utilization deacetylase AcuC-like enzyme
VPNRQIRSFSNTDAKIEFYYNDIYEVPLPPQHRFPMEKYKLVREKLTALNAEKTSDGQLEFCVSPLASREELVTTHCPKVYLSYLVSISSTEFDVVLQK